MYSIEHQIAQRTIRVKLAGFIQLSEMIEYGNALTAAFDRIPYKVFLLVDALENRVMPQDSIEELNRIRERNQANILKSAVVLDNEVLTRQTARTYQQVNVEWEEQYFRTLAQAEAWLAGYAHLHASKG